MAEPRLKLLQGWAAQRRGQIALARRRWKTGLIAARRDALPYDAGCLHWSLSQVDANGRTEHLEAANRLLSQCGGVPLLVEFGSNEILFSQFTLERSI